MKKLIIGLLGCLLLAACGSDNTITSPPDDDGGTPTNGASVVEVLASSTSLPSDDSAPVTITARVLNAANQAMADQAVTIQTSSGYLSDIVATTSASGIATAVLHTSSPANRNITVTASVGTLSDTVTVAVTGTTLAVSGASSIVLGSSSQYTITLLDAGGDGIANENVTVASSRGNGLNAGTVTTNSSGQATVTLTGSAGGADTLTVSALGMTATQAIAVSTDSFVFDTPAANTEIPLNQTINVTVEWTSSNVPQVGQTVSFSTTRGTLSSDTAVTNASGQATVTVSANNAGPATITASNSVGTLITLPVEFVATTPATIEVQGSPLTVGTGEQSSITAIVRDANQNLVKNQIVDFILTDTTGGSLSFGAVTTDSQGKAVTTYTAGSTTSAVNGVTVRAQTRSNTSIFDSIGLTVARREVFISLGTGNEIEEPTTAQYKKQYAIQVTDANGNGVANVPLTVRILSQTYSLGGRCWNGDVWRTDTVSTLPDEDVNNNGILDSGEDANTSTRLEAGNIASVTSNVTTGADGSVLVDVIYPQEYALWVNVDLSASTSVQGSEYVRTVNFDLPIAADDVTDENTSPPGVVSPFGSGGYLYGGGACP